MMKNDLLHRIHEPTHRPSRRTSGAWSATLSLVTTAAVAAPAAASPLALDLTAGLNYDAYISDAESAEANAYDPPGDWGLGNRRVSAVFGDHGLWHFGQNTYAFQHQVPGGGVGLPDDGQVTAGAWSYQLVTDLDAEPNGGWGNPHFASGEEIDLPLQPNVIRASSPHTGTADPEGAKVSVALSEAQWGSYQAINFLLSGTNDEFTIYADYADGQEALWTGLAPEAVGTLNPVDHPSHADLEAALQMTHYWASTGSPARSAIRDDDVPVMWQFTGDGLTLDPTRELRGLIIHLTPDNWNARDVNIYAASVIVPEPSSLGLTTAAASGLLALRRRRRGR